MEKYLLLEDGNKLQLENNKSILLEETRWVMQHRPDNSTEWQKTSKPSATTWSKQEKPTQSNWNKRARTSPKSTWTKQSKPGYITS